MKKTVKVVFLAFGVVAFLAILAVASFSFLISAPNSNSDKEVLFVISPGESLTSVSRRLEERGLIRNRYAFLLKTKLSSQDKKVQAGDFLLSASLSVSQVLQQLISGRVDIWLTIIPGQRAEQVVYQMQQELTEIDSHAWEEYFTAYEGELIPDSYLIPRQVEKEAVRQIINKNFQKQAVPLLEEAELSKDKILVLASLVEREAKTIEDKRKVAGVLLNRLAADWPLQVDATVQYAKANQTCRTLDCNWWPKVSGAETKSIQSHYNTYLAPGLPPAPICNPSLQSIKAVLEAPNDSPFWYYLSAASGKTYFSKNLAEHEENIARHLN